MSLTNTPNANRLHIGIYGKRNSGKSSLINALTHQQTALVSDVAGTTTDPVYKAMEVHPIGPCTFIDTAGFDDEGELGLLRVERTEEAVKKTDVALLVIADGELRKEEQWVKKLKEAGVPVIAVVNKADELLDAENILRAVKKQLGLDAVLVSAKTGEGVARIKEELVRAIPAEYEMQSIAGRLVSPGDVVLLVMPQDIQAPKSRLILPQVQTIRDLLDNKCLVMSVTTDKLDAALASLTMPPKLIITDSQVFKTVMEKKPKESLLTSFSVLFAAYKGDIGAFVEGAGAIDRLNEHSRVLIAEACTHAPLTEDIGRVKLPRILRQRFGEGLSVDMVSGVDFPSDLSQYDLIIHCGACMFNRKYVMTRIKTAREQGIPITNYGVAIAKLTGILDKVVY